MLIESGEFRSTKKKNIFSPTLYGFRDDAPHIFEAFARAYKLQFFCRYATAHPYRSDYFFFFFFPPLLVSLQVPPENEDPF